MMLLFYCTFLYGATTAYGQFMLSFGTPTPAGPQTFDQNCRDKLDNCHSFPDSSCRDPYVTWARENCPQRCGFCIGPTTPAPPCMNKLTTCETYQKDVCTKSEYKTWAYENCRYYCRMCPPAELARLDAITTTIAPTDCVDKVDCRQYGPNACSAQFRAWSKANCPAHCGYCVGSGGSNPVAPTQKPGYAVPPMPGKDIAVISYAPPTPPLPGKRRNVAKRQFHASHHHFGGDHSCWDATGRYKSDDPYCKTPAPSTLTTETNFIYPTKDFLGAEFKPRPTPTSGWDHKLNTTTVASQTPTEGMSSSQTKASTEQPSINTPSISSSNAPIETTSTQSTPSTTITEGPPDITTEQTTSTVGPSNAPITTESPVSTESVSTGITKPTSTPQPGSSSESTVASSTSSAATATVSTSIPSSSLSLFPSNTSTVITNAASTASPGSPPTVTNASSAQGTQATQTTQTTKSTQGAQITQPSSTVTVTSQGKSTALPPTVSTSGPGGSTSSSRTTPPPLPISSSTMTTTSGTPPKTTPVCKDTISNCAQYGPSICTSSTYGPWARSHCAAFCRFCIPATQTPFQCVDKLPNCNEFDGGNLCTADSYFAWSRENCFAYCGYPPCGTGPPLNSTSTTKAMTTTAATTPPTAVATAAASKTGVCEDTISNCLLYPDEQCGGVYAAWARAHCAKRCGYCNETLPCVDNNPDCNLFPSDICVKESYQGWARENCRKFCNLCTVPTVSSHTGMSSATPGSPVRSETPVIATSSSG